jgi:hypothetical protein
MNRLRTPTTPRNHLTIAERSKLRIEERERKLKHLQEQLMVEYTFTPRTNTSSHSITSSITTMTTSPDPNVVFDRLYNRETAAMRARRESTPGSAKRRSLGTPSYSNRTVGLKDSFVTPTRLVILHHEGQDRLRARMRTDEVRRFFACGSDQRSRWNTGSNVVLSLPLGGGRGSTTPPRGSRAWRLYIHS